MPIRRRLLAGLLLLGGAGCAGEPLAGMYCERRDTDPDCVSIKPVKDADTAVVGTVSIKSRASASPTVRRAGKKKYTLHRDGKTVGTIEQGDAEWITVTLTDGAPYSKSMRADGARGVME